MPQFVQICALTAFPLQSSLITFSAVSLRGKPDGETFGKLGPVLPQLSTVDLSAIKLTDAGIAKLATLPDLKPLHVWETPVTAAVIDALKHKLANCKIIGGAALGAAPAAKPTPVAAPAQAAPAAPAEWDSCCPAAELPLERAAEEVVEVTGFSAQAYDWAPVGCRHGFRT